MNIGMSAGSRDCPLASLGDDVLRQSAEVFVQNVSGQRGCEYRPTDRLRVLGPTEAIKDVDLQRADVATLVLGDVRTVEPLEGFLKASCGEKAFADILDRHAFGAGEALRRDVSVNVAARIGDVFQGDRQRSLPVTVLSGRCMVEALAHHAFEFIQAGRAECL
jgi:hypothetical protein